ncbi:GATOR1 complex protein NPRL3-like isoform X2 [Corticium candelabrum]|uniref:GATOR1 complex protein NPRL3-like isoform X2 n=1 Tax=Corticium candelabrum TaxID=121492 RepID=UPI002E331EB5|nr:GATOR1 complex protein NPRL3-like isoform X2 [Corticium candelabrum]
MTKPLSVILVTCGSRGDRLLFRYPYEFVSWSFEKGQSENAQSDQTRVCSSNLELSEYPDDVLAGLLTPKLAMCGQKFQLAVDNLTFVGYPSFARRVAKQDSNRCCQGDNAKSLFQFNVVFALPTNATSCVIAAYHDLVKRLAIGMAHEERRCSFLSEETAVMLAAHEREAARIHDEQTRGEAGSFVSHKSPFAVILEKSQLAQLLKHLYKSLHGFGQVSLLINNWIHISFILPSVRSPLDLQHSSAVGFSNADYLLNCDIRPYHAILLMEDQDSLCSSLPEDSSPCLKRLIQLCSPLKSLQTLSGDTDLSLCQVFELTAHLVYWRKAMTIYPLSESNVYVLAPDADTSRMSDLVKEFVQKFPGMYLPVWLSQFSLPTPLGEHQNPLGESEKQNEKLVQMVVWMLQHRLLIQLHTYVYLAPMGINLSEVEESLSPMSMLGSRTTSFARSSFDSSFIDSDKSMADNAGMSPRQYHYLRRFSIASMSDHSSIADGDIGETEEDPLINLDPALRDAVHQVEASKDINDLKLFARLCGYFDGKYHLEEIMYRENITRSQLLTVIDKFGEVLITCTHAEMNK